MQTRAVYWEWGKQFNVILTGLTLTAQVKFRLVSFNDATVSVFWAVVIVVKVK